MRLNHVVAHCAAAVVAAAAIGCDPSAPKPAGSGGARGDSAASLRTAQPGAERRLKSTALIPDSHTWSREQAIAQLNDHRGARSAAVRLARLAELDTLLLPAEPSEQQLLRLTVRSLGESGFVCGLGDRKDSRVVYAPFWVLASGDTRVLASGVGEELLFVRVSEDTDIIPHVVVGPERVSVFDAGALRPAIVLGLAPEMRMDCAVIDDEPTVVLRWMGDRGAPVVARYDWSAAEQAFVGPAAQTLAPPYAGRFEMDLELSELLEPVGGDMPAPRENRRPPERDQTPDAMRASSPPRTPTARG